MGVSVTSEQQPSINTKRAGVTRILSENNTATALPSQQRSSDTSTRISFSDDDTNDNPNKGDRTTHVHKITREQLQHEQESWRQVVGKGMHAFSDIVNENIVAARYATVASIVLLSAYGISRTPLFFRYKTVSEIPASFFKSRRSIHGRIVRVVESNNNSTPGTFDHTEKPIVCLIRHSSPMGRLLNRSAFNVFHRASPAAAIGKRLEDDALLQVEIAGLMEAPHYLASAHVEQPGEWLNRLAKHRVPVKCELLARRVKVQPTSNRLKDALPEIHDTQNRVEENRIPEDQIAVCRIRYRPPYSDSTSVVGGILQQLFRTDVASALVRNGRASVLPSGMYISDEQEPLPAYASFERRVTVDASTRLSDLRQDATYLEKLGIEEFEAVKDSKGMWADPNVRESRKDLVDEAHFEKTATTLQKLWRWVRG
mmetsp:Transcript_23848/g.36874  ORF Transcript_23848/g.36874 Transcript_23848/m.36874 type:complete len:427 (-) Transcript_23848:1231-2511(-)